MGHDGCAQQLIELTSIPTAAGREHRVIRWIERWAHRRDKISLRRDATGNLLLEQRLPEGAERRRPLFITAHLDHPAFVISEIVSPTEVRVEFRGGVLDPYFPGAPLTIFTANDHAVSATLRDAPKAEPFRTGIADLDSPSRDLVPGDIGRWAMDDPAIEGDILHTHACDDLSAASAALEAFDTIVDTGSQPHVTLLFTLAEEVGFVGAIAACQNATIPSDAHVLALENSRSYAESPIGDGPIVRVGDKTSTFTPELTASVCAVCEILAQGADSFRWQRRLMPGGTCEASCFMTWGYSSTCICLPLGNYHNMARLSEVERQDADALAAARCAREYISLTDYRSLIDLLVECAESLADESPVKDRLQGLYDKHAFVLEDSP